MHSCFIAEEILGYIMETADNVYNRRDVCKRQHRKEGKNERIMVSWYISDYG